MAFQNKNLSVVAYANNWTLWHYKTEDKMSEIDMDYFPKDVVKLMACGDMIIINAEDYTGIKYVESITEGKVKICDIQK